MAYLGLLKWYDRSKGFGVLSTLTFSSTSNGGMPMTVPVINDDFSE